MQTADTILMLVQIWVWAGIATAAVFLSVGMDRVEPNARTSFIFRPLLIPATVILWPLVLWRWFVLETGRDQPLQRHRPPRPWHRRLWIVFSVLIPLILISGLIIRQDGPWERPAVLLEKPE